ncbi:MAG: hypothetical protein AAF600_06610, partial [Bacteroidota bacterium]
EGEACPTPTEAVIQAEGDTYGMMDGSMSFTREDGWKELKLARVFKERHYYLKMTSILRVRSCMILPEKHSKRSVKEISGWNINLNYCWITEWKL